MYSILHGLKRGFVKCMHFECIACCKLGCPFPQNKVFMERGAGGWGGGCCLIFLKVFLNTSTIFHYYFKYIVVTSQLLKCILLIL